VGKSANEGKFDYDLVVMGSGPSGQRAAVQGAKLRKKVAIIEASREVGGVWTNSGTIPSKSFREAVLYLSGFRQRAIYGSGYRLKPQITMKDLTYRIESIVRHENQVIQDQLTRNRIEVLQGTGRLAGANTVQITASGTVTNVTADKIVLAVGTRPHHPDGLNVDGERVLDSDSILNLRELPRTICIVGGGIIGVEYASMFAVLGVKVSLIETRKEILNFVDSEIVESLQYHLRNLGITFRLGEEVLQTTRRTDGQVETTLKSGKKIITDYVLVSAGRQGATDNINLESVGLVADKYGRLTVNENYQTAVPYIYAVGDVVGWPALASTAMQQGRIAACHAFTFPDESEKIPLPYGIYTIPEISMVGETEATLTEASIPYEVGIARYKEIARGGMIGDDVGMLKLIFHRDTKQLLGVHIIGEGATEIIHLGQAVLHLKGGLEYLVDCVFNNPTLSECYKVAALDGLNKIRA
jgi:NAD(P) transhydrogenase